ncbi:hypothetical protein C0Q70_07215 [Pomacea canaliculata]|uniref:C-type lectin domain-containing protein n=1 Tax=Pomacea canaliculata TaxID=400727 RepID=A0A2T7PEG0_POMCA|nr:uncharacterized protein LOC112562969 [Pomacea canaliculata]PVD31797.1 hypothetical protein C0Q70_07215 [Pomacea canaliculata]
MDEFGSKIQDSIETFNKSVSTHCLKIDRQTDKLEVLTEAMNEQQRKTEAWMSLMSNELKQIKSSLTETWTSKTADQLNDLKSNFSTIAKILVALETKTDTWVSEIRNKVIAIENILQVLDGKTVELNQTAQLTLSSLMRARCQDKGYTLYEGRCWKFYPLKYHYAQAERVCREDKGHLVHLKSRAQDVQPFLDFLAKQGKHLDSQWANCVWMGADDIKRRVPSSGLMDTPTYRLRPLDECSTRRL